MPPTPDDPRCLRKTGEGGCGVGCERRFHAGSPIRRSWSCVLGTHLSHLLSCLIPEVCQGRAPMCTSPGQLSPHLISIVGAFVLFPVPLQMALSRPSLIDLEKLTQLCRKLGVGQMDQQVLRSWPHSSQRPITAKQ